MTHHATSPFIHSDSEAEADTAAGSGGMVVALGMAADTTAESVAPPSLSAQRRRQRSNLDRRMNEQRREIERQRERQRQTQRRGAPGRKLLYRGAEAAAGMLGGAELFGSRTPSDIARGAPPRQLETCSVRRRANGQYDVVVTGQVSLTRRPRCSRLAHNSKPYSSRGSFYRED